MQTKRLLLLAAHLKTVPPKSFNIGPLRDDVAGTRCVLGHALLIPAFKRAGLKETTGWEKGEQNHGMLDYRKWFGFGAATRFFGVDYDTATSLFHRDGYKAKRVTPKLVARKIERLVKEGSL